tara:strand:- start:82707 stop:83219 length:513 start_codon:yes stop_codon:yes gene_type:complete
MTLELIVFIVAILFGIIWYWRESKNNKIYRLVNRVSNAKELQMKPDNMKGFIHKQPFLIRLVWVTLLFVISGAVISFVTPINAFYIQYFASAIVGTLIGTYIASVFIFAQDRTKKEDIDKAFQKGKDLVEDFTDSITKDLEEEPLKEKPKPETPSQKSARDRFKDKGMIK